MYVVLTIMINLSFDHSSPATLPFTFTEADHQREVEIVSTRVFSIQLPTQMGSGYQWTFSEEEHPEIKLLSHVIKDEKPMPGGRQLQIFTLKPHPKGSYSIKLELKRPWEEQAIRHYQLKVKVVK
jgi:predicted secreted protein